jgi:hypothetical protein
VPTDSRGGTGRRGPRVAANQPRRATPAASAPAPRSASAPAAAGSARSRPAFTGTRRCRGPSSRLPAATFAAATCRSTSRVFLLVGDAGTAGGGLRGNGDWESTQQTASPGDVRASRQVSRGWTVRSAELQLPADRASGSRTSRGLPTVLRELRDVRAPGRRYTSAHSPMSVFGKCRVWAKVVSLQVVGRCAPSRWRSTPSSDELARPAADNPRRAGAPAWSSARSTELCEPVPLVSTVMARGRPADAAATGTSRPLPRSPRPAPEPRVRPAQASSGSVNTTAGMPAARTRPCAAMTSTATRASCDALCASIGSPATSPIAKMFGSAVRRCGRSHEPFASTLDLRRLEPGIF